MMHQHPANVARHDETSRGGRAADRVAAFMGSWRFIGIQTAIITVWITLNAVALVHHWDPYPFILLNLLFSTQAAYAAPILQLATNRQSEHDRVRAEHDYLTGAQTQALLRYLAAHHGIGADEIERVVSVVSEP
jgi:uncharacterized membrane protein